MALLGKSLALVSVGITCQPAFQMRLNHALIQDITREALEEHSTPFDWILCDVPGVAGMIRDRRFFPNDLTELKFNGGKPYWKRYGCHFWHHKLGQSAGPSAEKWLDRARHVAETWNGIGEAKRRVFIVSNAARASAQQALADREMTKTALDWNDLFSLYAELGKTFGTVELHVVTPDNLGSGNASIVVHHTNDGAPHKWKGSAPFWERLFRRICG